MKLVILFLAAANAAHLPIRRAAAEGPPEVGTEVRGYQYQGCYSDSRSSRSLKAKLYSESSMTSTSCITMCANAGYDLAGLETGTDCWCDNVLGSSAKLIAASSCAPYVCPGDRKQNCGGDLALALYATPDWVSPAEAAASSSSSASAASSLSASISKSSSRSLSQSASASEALSLSRSASASSYSSSSQASLALSQSISESISASASAAQSISRSISASQSASAATSLSHSQSVSASQASSLAHSIYISQSVSESLSASQSASASIASSVSLSQSISQSASAAASLSQSVSASQATSLANSLSASQSVSASLATSLSVSQSISQSVSASQSASASLAYSVSRSHSESLSASQSASAAASLAISESLSQSVSQSVSASQSALAAASLASSQFLSQSVAESLSASQSASASLASSVSQSLSESISVSQSASAAASLASSESLSASQSVSASLAASASLSQSIYQSLSASQSASAAASLASSESLSQSVSQSVSASQSASAAASLASSESLSQSVSESLSASQSASAAAALVISQSLSQSVSESLSASQSASAALATSVSQSLSESISASQSAIAASLASSESLSANQSASAALATSVSQSLSESISASQSAFAASLSSSESLSQSVSQSLSASQSASAAVASSVSQSLSEYIAASESEAVASSLSQSISASQSASALAVSVSQSLSESVSASQSAFAASLASSESLSQSVSASQASLASSSQAVSSLSHSMSEAASASASLASATALSQSLSASASASLASSLSASEAASLSQSISASQSADYAAQSASASLSASASPASSLSQSISESLPASQGAESLSPSESLSASATATAASASDLQTSSDLISLPSAAGATVTSSYPSPSVEASQVASSTAESITQSSAGGASSQGTSQTSSVAPTSSPAAATALPSPWVAAGPNGALVTIAEGATGRALTGAITSTDDMTFAKCVDYCSSQGFTIAGVEYAAECHCGHMLMNGAALSRTSANGNMACSGDSASMCGGSSALTLFIMPSTAAKLTPDLDASISVEIPSGWVGAGISGQACIAESTTGRALTGASTSSNDMTYTKCLDYCAGQGFALAAIEYASECFCGNTLVNGAALSKLSSQCNMPCSGDAWSICGGPSALSLFISSAAVETLNADLTVSTVVAAVSLPNGWVSAGTSGQACIAESTSGRALTGTSISSSDMTYAKCLGYCSEKGFVLAAIEYASECFCGNTLVNGAALSTTSTQCNMACSGERGSICGGPDALTLFATTEALEKLNDDLTALVNAPAMVLPAGWVGAGTSGPACIAESSSGRALTGASTSSSDMTYSKCLEFCGAKGFVLAAIEYSSECFCGNTLVNDAALSKTSTQCNMPCSGDAFNMCGGPSALTLFVTSGHDLNPELTASSTPTTIALPSGWSGAGPDGPACIAEGTSGRALTGASVAGNDMTYKMCLAFCGDRGFALAAIEYSSECFCGNMLVNGAALSKSSLHCNMPCSGDYATICGGPDALTLFATSVGKLNTDLNAPLPVILPAGWATASTPCIAEGTSGHALAQDQVNADDMTPSKCMEYCGAKGYAYAGLEYSKECYCGSSIQNGASLDSPSSSCNMACGGESTQLCGGPGALNLFFNSDLSAATVSASVTLETSGSMSSSTSISSSTSSSSSSTASPTSPSTSSSTSSAAEPTVKSQNLPTGWSPASTPCIQEVAGRSLDGAATYGSSMTINQCLDFCASQGMQYAGVEYGSECFCGRTLANGASLSLSSEQCYTPCPGDSTTLCGGPNAIQLYSNPTITAPVVKQVDGFYQAGCIQEVDGHALNGTMTAANDMTAETCGAFCSTAGFKMFGLEYGRECYCGNSLSNQASTSLVSQMCNMACAGDSRQICGGPSALSLYTS